jgi:hypothetical protein
MHRSSKSSRTRHSSYTAPNTSAIGETIVRRLKDAGLFNQWRSCWLRFAPPQYTLYCSAKTSRFLQQLSTWREPKRVPNSPTTLRSRQHNAPTREASSEPARAVNCPMIGGVSHSRPASERRGNKAAKSLMASHAKRMPNPRTQRCGRSRVSESATGAARPHSLQ